MILLAAWHTLADGTFYQDPGAAGLDRVDIGRVSKQLIRRLNAMGFDVIRSPKAT